MASSEAALILRVSFSHVRTHIVTKLAKSDTATTSNAVGGTLQDCTTSRFVSPFLQYFGRYATGSGARHASAMVSAGFKPTPAAVKAAAPASASGASGLAPTAAKTAVPFFAASAPQQSATMMMRSA